MKKIRNNTESQLRRTNGALQKISKTVFMGANEVKRLKAEIKSLNKVIKKQEKKYLKLDEKLRKQQFKLNVIDGYEDEIDRTRKILDKLYEAIDFHNLKCEKHSNGKQFFFEVPS